MNDAVVGLVDDDPMVLDVLARGLRDSNIIAHVFASGESLLADDRFETISCVVTDVNMDGISGLELRKLIFERKPILPVIIMSGQGGIPMAVDAMQDGAFDFLSKPFAMSELVERVILANQLYERREQKYAVKNRANERLSKLSEREGEVMKHITDGHTNKTTGALLQISEKTVESHRAKIMQKLDVGGLADLIKIRAEATSIIE